MSSEHTECFFEIDTGDGWEKSLTKILSSFEDPVFDINPALGYAYVKGKTDRHKILKKLKKGEKHSELKRITFGSEEDNSNNSNNNNNNHNHPYASLSRMGHLYDPYHYANSNPYSNYHPYANYHPWHNNNNLNPLFLNNNARNYHGANHHPHHLPREWRGPFHRRDSPVLTSSSSSPVTTSSSSRPVKEPKPNPPAQPLRSARSRRFGFFKKVFSIKKVKDVTGKFRSCLLRFSDKFK